ncbi:FAD-dependent oxidoreductase [Prosthecochloris sp. N3]|uniref:FAD-dependent oxidoreductase n=1 Tax=Prosthecochloris ethylica TaxID=2743976 RepID=A0ABR9XR11_9CHLB|nr:FAD-dependent oxidoreductase [Prosthecochloris ethylica]MBF0585551.1 FAD-dependent oxidoreductase [Prosthecochloris ethylica]MBF0636337.1 FAD-dependent oxidoreductase [Prosthecochloris ethylica]NUK46781.1 FAD-dependent oxidoreductase [Prosthecochloris ethylica]
MDKVAVIGGGISGMAASMYLLAKGFRVELFESSPELGGRTGSLMMADGRQVDAGGKNIGRKYTRFRQLVDTIGPMEYEYFGLNTSQVVDREIVRLSREQGTGSAMRAILRFAGVAGIARLYPLVRALRRDREQGFLNTSYFNRISRKHDRATLASWFPRRCAEHLIRPMTVRMNGAEPDECYPGNFGSNLALVLDSYDQLTEGMHGMISRFERFAGDDMVLKEHHVESMEHHDATTTLHVRSPGGRYRRNFRKVVVALPACDAARLWTASFPELADLLGRIRYYPVGVALVRYRHDVFSSAERAMIFGSQSLVSNAGAYGIGDRNLVRYTFSGRASRDLLEKGLPAERMIALAEEAIEPYFSVSAGSRESSVYRRFSPGLCAYSAYHYSLLEALDRYLGTWRGVSVTGDFRRGASIEACCRAAEESVESLTGGADRERNL